MALLFQCPVSHEKLEYPITFILAIVTLNTRFSISFRCTLLPGISTVSRTLDYILTCLEVFSVRSLMSYESTILPLFRP